jgi:PAS domain-containing protein
LADKKGAETLACSSITPGKLSALIGTIYDAALSPHLWEQFMGEARTIFAATASTFFQLDGLAPNNSVVDVHGMDTAYEAEHLERQPTEDYWLLEARKLNSGAVKFGTDLISIDAMHRTPYYQEVVRHSDIEYMLGLVVHNGADRQFYLSLLRGRLATNFAPEEYEALKFLLPHVQKAYFLQNQLAQRASFQQALEQSPYGIVVLDASRKALYTNQRAEHYLREQDGITLRHGRVKLHQYSDQQKIDAGISRVLAPPESLEVNGKTCFAIKRPSGKLPYQVVLSSLNSRTDEIPLIPSAACALFIHDPDTTAGISRAMLKATYGLTEAEARLCEQLFCCSDLNKVTDMLGISRNTARTHMKRIFAKARVNSQAELMRNLALGLKGY